MLFTSQGWSILGKTVPEVLDTYEAIGLVSISTYCSIDSAPLNWNKDNLHNEYQDLPLLLIILAPKMTSAMGKYQKFSCKTRSWQPFETLLM